MDAAGKAFRASRTLAILGLVLSLSAARPCLGQVVNREQSGAWPSYVTALQATVQTGRPTVVIITSQSSQASTNLVTTLSQIVPYHPLGKSLAFAEMSAESFPAEIARMKIKTYPTAVVYVKEGAKIRLLDWRAGALDAPTVIGWLGSLTLTPASPTIIDPALVQASYGGDQYASGQNYPSSQNQNPPYQPPQQQPPQQPAQMPYYPVQTAQPSMYSGAPSQPVIVTTPSTPVVFQPQAPQIIVGPNPQPNIVFANAPGANVQYVQPGNAPTANAPQQIFMGNAPTAGPPANAPTANAPMANAPMANAPMAMAPMGNAPTGNSPFLAAALLTNPSLINRILGAIGEALAERKNPRIRMTNTPTVGQAPVGMAPAGYAPVGYGYAPGYPPGMIGVPVPPQGGFYGPPPGYCPPQNYPQQQPAYNSPPPNAPSPQDQGGYGPYPSGQGQAPRTSLFRRLIGH